jgi:uncharacterized membrane protein YfcA
MEWYLFPLIALAGFLAGFINTLAGSGSIVILLLLPILGLSPAVANGTNRIGVLAQTLVSSGTYLRNKIDIPKSFYWQLVPAIAGGIGGAFISVEIPEQLRKWLEASLMLPILLMIIRNPGGWLDIKPSQDRSTSLTAVIVFFLIGLYGGFLQAGVGIYLLVAFVMYTGYSISTSNFLKVVITGAFTLPALVIFMWNGQVNWTYGIIISVGQSIGAFVATRFAVGHPDANKWVKKLLAIMVVISIFRFSELDVLIFEYLFK